MPNIISDGQQSRGQNLGSSYLSIDWIQRPQHLEAHAQSYSKMHMFSFFSIFPLFLDRVSLDSPGCSSYSYDPLVSRSTVVGLKGYINMPFYGGVWGEEAKSHRVTRI